jgi:hypothetical protein
MADTQWFKGPGGLDAPACQAFAVTPNDAADLAFTSRGIWVGGAGNIAVILLNDSSAVTFVGLAAGTFLPLGVKRVMSTNTTATNIVAVY